MDILEVTNLLRSQIQNKPALGAEEQTSVNNVKNEEETPTQTTSTSADTPNTSQTTQQTTGADFSTFLTLLTAQIKNQDPLAPLDSTQFVEQLATFSNLELQAKGNQSLERITALLSRQIELLTPNEDLITPPETTENTAI
jgi:flagellar hook assembly protein FlgD